MFYAYVYRFCIMDFAGVLYPVRLLAEKHSIANR